MLFQPSAGPKLVLRFKSLSKGVCPAEVIMRIISGHLKGRILKSPKGRGIRPTSDQVKESLFNMIQAELPGCVFLDLCAGTGNVGIEALSRGAEHAVFVEKHPAHARLLQQNLNVCNLSSKSRVYCHDVNKILTVLHKARWCFDVIFLDPPYRQTNLLTDVLSRLVDFSLCSPEGLIIAEHSQTFTPSERLGAACYLIKRRRLGNTTLSFYGQEA